MIDADLISAAAVTVAALSVALGVNAWRREFVGKRRIELAEDMLAAFYEVEDAIRYIRHPAGHSGEGKTRKRGEQEYPEESEARDNAYVVMERYEERRDEFAKLRSLKYRSMATFGEQAKEPFDEITKVINKIFLASYMLGSHYWNPLEREANRDEGKHQQHIERMRDFESIFWQVDDNDEIGSRVHSAVTEVEEIAMQANRIKASLPERIGLKVRGWI